MNVVTEVKSKEEELSTKVVDFALSLVGTPFVSHSKLHTNGNSHLGHEHTPVSPETGFDCIGFVGYAFAEGTGLYLPRHVVETFCAVEEGYIGETVLHNVGTSDFRPGDIVLFRRNNPFVPTHAAIYCGNGNIVHSSQRTKGVAVTPLEDMLPRLFAVMRVKNGLTNYK